MVKSKGSERGKDPAAESCREDKGSDCGWILQSAVLRRYQLRDEELMNAAHQKIR